VKYRTGCGFARLLLDARVHQRLDVFAVNLSRECQVRGLAIGKGCGVATYSASMTHAPA
jgi:hypothetical protein